MNAHARIFSCGQPLVGEVPLGQFQNLGVQLDVVHAFQSRVLERLQQGALPAAADQQKAAWLRVLQQSVVDGFLGGGRVGRGSRRQAGLVKGPAALGLDHGEVAVNGVARLDDAEAAPERVERNIFERLCCNPAGSPHRGCQQGRPGSAQRQPRRNHEVHARHQPRNTERPQPADQHQAGHYTPYRRPGGFQQVDATAGGRGVLLRRLHAQPARRGEQPAGKRTERRQHGQAHQQHSPGPQHLARHRLQRLPAPAHRCNAQRERQGDAELQHRHQALRPPAADRDPPEQPTTRGRPDEPACQHQPERKLVAVENHHQLAHEDDLGVYRSEADQPQRDGDDLATGFARRNRGCWHRRGRL
jgi:hypothetical protein